MRIVAIACGDIHLTLTAPACRAEQDWLAVQAGYLEQLNTIAGGLPILCSGDFFDRWNAMPELITFALKHLPDGMLCVPGQHDLPNHLLEHKYRSGYGVLSEAGKIVDLSHTVCCKNDDFVAYGFGWEAEILPPSKKILKGNSRLNIAVIHRYVWTIGNSYLGAPEQAHLGKFLEPLRRYDVAVFGDNHKGFFKNLKTGTRVVNCGTFLRRKSDELDYSPSVWKILEDGSVERMMLDTSKDLFHEQADQREESPVNMRRFIEGLKGLGEQGLNFQHAVKHYLETEDIDPRTRKLVLQALENENKRGTI